MTQPLQPELPYADALTGRSSGWSGSETSAERAHRRDADGDTERLQRRVLGYVAATGEFGATIDDLRKAFPDHHHGSLSGCLSNLHKSGHVARLTDTRNHCKIYVTPRWVADRPTERQGR